MIKKLIRNLIYKTSLDFVHPIGSFYDTDDADFDPNKVWGGSWELYVNRVRVGAGDLYQLGDEFGSVDHQHRVGMQYVGAYYDTNLEQYGILDMTGGATNVLGTRTYVTGSYNVNNATAGSSKTMATNRFTQIGKTEEADNLQPSYAVYMWHRIA